MTDTKSLPIGDVHEASFDTLSQIPTSFLNQNLDSETIDLLKRASVQAAELNLQRLAGVDVDEDLDHVARTVRDIALRLNMTSRAFFAQYFRIFMTQLADVAANEFAEFIENVDSDDDGEDDT